MQAVRKSGRWWRLTVWGVLALLFLAPAMALAAGGKPATKLVSVADTRDMDAGLSKWIADVYNDNLWLYGALVVVVMAGMGLILGLSFDKLLVKLGLDLGKLEHHE